MSNLKPLSIAATGKNITTSGTSAHTGLPPMLSGDLPKYCVITSTVAAHVRWGQGTQTAVATDLLLNPNYPQVINTMGCTDIAAIQDASAGAVNVAPLEWAN